MAVSNTTRLDLFWQKVDKESSSNGCWLWTAYKDPLGYGRFNVGGRVSLAHRFAYLQKHQIEDGQDLHHECENASCVNPAHLRPVTRLEHAALTPQAKEAARHTIAVAIKAVQRMRLAKTTCARGHAFVQGLGRRRCKECRNLNQNRLRKARRAAAA